MFEIQDDSAFFEGLDANGVEVTTAEYINASMHPHFWWEVHSFGENANGYWILLIRKRPRD